MSYTGEQIKQELEFAAARSREYPDEQRWIMAEIIEQLLRERDEAKKRFEQTLAAVKAGHDLARDNSTKRNKQLTDENDNLSEIIIRLDARVTEAKSTALKAVRERIAGLHTFPITNDPEADEGLSRHEVLTAIDEEMNRA